MNKTGQGHCELIFFVVPAGRDFPSAGSKIFHFFYSQVVLRLSLLRQFEQICRRLPRKGDGSSAAVRELRAGLFPARLRLQQQPQQRHARAYRERGTGYYFETIIHGRIIWRRGGGGVLMCKCFSPCL